MKHYFTPARIRGTWKTIDQNGGKTTGEHVIINMSGWKCWFTVRNDLYPNWNYRPPSSTPLSLVEIVACIK